MSKKLIIILLFVIIFINNAFSQTASPLEIDSAGIVNVDKKLKHTNGNTYDPLPVGTILMYSGIDWVDNKIPGWKACTAANNQANANIPNLENTFIMGTSTTSIADTSVSRTGGKNSITASDLPQHSHTINHGHGRAYGATYDPNASDAYGDGYHAHDLLLPIDHHGNTTVEYGICGNGDNGNDLWKNYSGHGLASTHAHNVYVDVSDHTGSSGTVGTNTTMNNRPKYYTVIYIIKVSN